MTGKSWLTKPHHPSLDAGVGHRVDLCQHRPSTQLNLPAFRYLKLGFSETLVPKRPPTGTLISSVVDSMGTTWRLSQPDSD